MLLLCLNPPLKNCKGIQKAVSFSAHRTESCIIHRFQQPGVFVVVVECTTSDWHVTAQKSITIQEPIGEFRVAKCYGSNVTTDGTKCNILYGSPAQIQLGLETGESCFTIKVC